MVVYIHENLGITIKYVLYYLNIVNSVLLISSVVHPWFNDQRKMIQLVSIFFAIPLNCFSLCSIPTPYNLKQLLQ